jgi:phosphopantothenoylcysteine decarboxylase
MTGATPIVLLAVCAAPPAAKVAELAELLRNDGWDVYPVLTDAATAWVDTASLEIATGHLIRSERRGPEEPKSLPRADAIVVAPATFNTINQWAAGINDTAALGILNEALGAGIPIVASPYAKSVLTAHPVFRHNLDLLAAAGVLFTETDALRPVAPNGSFNWRCVLDLLADFGLAAMAPAAHVLNPPNELHISAEVP